MSHLARVVLYVAKSSFVGGAERSLIRIAGALDTGRFKPRIVTAADGDFAQALTAAGLPFNYMHFSDPHRLWPFPFAASVSRLYLALRRAGAALLHANDAPAFPAASIAARLYRVPRICHIRFTYEAGFLRWLLAPGFERAVFASEYMKRYAQEICPELFPDRLCVVVRNGLECPPPPPASELLVLRRRLVGEKARQIVGFFGQVIELKGVRDFLEMALLLRQRFSDARYLVVGDDKQEGASYRKQMETFARNTGLADAVLFLGYQKDVWPLMNLCDVIVMPSHVEPFGNVALEAAAAARPFVASKIGGLPEIVRDGETGLLCPPRSPHAFAAATARLLENPALARSLGDRSREHVAANFTLARQVEVLQDLYQEVLEAHWRR